MVTNIKEIGFETLIKTLEENPEFKKWLIDKVFKATYKERLNHE